MLTYWLIFLVPAYVTIMGRGTGPWAIKEVNRLDPAWLMVFLSLTVLIGLRFEVGGDWGNYIIHVYLAEHYLSLSEMMIRGDPGYWLLTWASAQAGLGIYGINLVCGIVFSLGLVYFCRHQPRPWLALAVAVPYVVIVLGMGYSRQGVALGLAMLGLVALGRGQPRWFVFWVIVGATFHKSAVLLLPIAALTATHSRIWTTVWVGVIVAGAYWVFLEESVESLYAGYIEAGYQSQGALIRLSMNAVPALIFLLSRRRFVLRKAEVALWSWFSIISVLLLLLLFVSPSSTAVDRVALYMLPLQLVVFSHLPDAFGTNGKTTTRNLMVVLGFYGFVLYVWLNYASHSGSWIPYRFYLIERFLQ